MAYFNKNFSTKNAFEGSGLSLTNLNASNIASGTIANERTTATDLNVNNSIVLRNSSGGFTATTISATDFNSTSDKNLKENIKTSAGLEVVLKLRGVEFDFIDTKIHSSGVIAQEIEKIIPHVVNTNNYKTVSYNQIIAYLIEGMKEQQVQIDTLRKEIETLKNV